MAKRAPEMRAIRALRLFTPMHFVHLTPRTPRESQATDQDGEHGEASGSLHVTGQSQQAVIHLALDLTCALHNAIHPKAFPNDLSRHYVVTDEGSDSPQGDGTDYRPTHPAHNGHD